MRLAYLDCATGISGDMTLAALVDAGVDAAAIRAGIDSLKLPGVSVEWKPVTRCGFRALHLEVRHPEQHAHRRLADIFKLIDAADRLTPSQRQLAKDIFTAIGIAEAKVHHSSLEQVHFHEVGAIDSIVDIVGAAIGFDLLNVESIVSSPIPPGRGKVKIAHGVCPVPAPATAELLVGIPLVDVPVEYELTTPTGAAILKTVVDEFGPLPALTTERIGYGAGTRDFPDRPNTLRVIVGSTRESSERDVVLLLETNLDDVAGEIIGYTKQRLWEAGALDVFSTAIQMKKDRPGVLLSVLCQPADQSTCEAILFSETQTLGIRRSLWERNKRPRQVTTLSTPWGDVRGKIGGGMGGSGSSSTPEYEDCARLAREQGIPLREIYRAALASAPLPENLGSGLTHEDSAAGSASPAPTHDHAHDHHHDHDHYHDHSHDHDHGTDHDHGHDHHHH